MLQRRLGCERSASSRLPLAAARFSPNAAIGPRFWLWNLHYGGMRSHAHGRPRRLITRRSQVQILPRYLERAGNGAFAYRATMQEWRWMAGEVIGREQELEEPERILDAVDGLPAALALEGSRGIGKRVLWRAGLDLARERGFRVLEALPASAETRLSLSARVDLLVPRLPMCRRRCRRDSGGRSRSSSCSPNPRVASGCGALDAALLSGRGFAGDPLLVAVDDVQWLDELPQQRSRSLRRLPRTDRSSAHPATARGRRAGLVDLHRDESRPWLNACPGAAHMGALHKTDPIRSPGFAPAPADAPRP